MNPLIIANWKMNLRPNQAADLALDMKKILKKEVNKDIVICPSFTALDSVSNVIKKTNISLGAQNVFWKDSGAFTGEESIKNLKEFGCEYVIVGHSDRRRYFYETNEMINKKISACLDGGMTPVLCIGENMEERREGKAEHVLWSQLTECLKNIDLMPSEQIVIAYEPVWAISTSGTGQVMEVSDVQRSFNLVYQNLIDLWPLTIVNNNVRILYGGSVDGQISAELSNIDKIKGFLVGGASLDSQEFAKIIKNIQ